MLIQINIDKIKPAKYNPRVINIQQFEKLKESIKQLGFIIPAIINQENNTIIAGHQRSKAAKALGINQIKAFTINKCYLGDEIKFNQLHNATDKQEENAGVCYANETGVIKQVDYKFFKIDKFNANRVKEIGLLIARYGNVFCSVVCNGEIICGADYIKASQLMRIDPYVSYIPCEKYSIAKKYLNSNYGEYSYSHLKKDTYVQGLAQLHRSAYPRDGKKQYASNLYELMVLKQPISKETKLLDFGCGKGAYVKRMEKICHATGLEFYNNNGRQIDASAGNKMIDNVVSDLTVSRYDIVVCDSVLNSVDSIEAEKSVVTCCNAFLKPNGKLYISGRPIDDVFRHERATKQIATKKRELKFLDNNNFTANYRQGKWFYQHFHSKEAIKLLLENHGFKVLEIKWMTAGGSFQISAIKIKEIAKTTVMKAIDFEFSLPLPYGKRYDRATEVKEACGQYY